MGRPRSLERAVCREASRVRRRGLRWPAAGPGLDQLDGYLERLGLETGVLVLFDRRPDAPPLAARTRFEPATTPTGRAITVRRA